ncbi:MAG TPA: CHAT domain-containing protein, partial [Thermoanaerobaculia bacterium]
QRDGGDPTAILADLRRARSALDEARAFAARPREVASAPLPTPEAVEIPRDTTVVEFVAGKSATTALVGRNVNGATEFASFQVDADPQTLRTLVNDFATAVESRDARYRATGRRLYELLLRPAIGAQPSGGKLCVMPDGVLWRVPFQALIAANGEHVVERVPLFYAPSLAILLAKSRASRRGAPTVLALGNPELDAVTRGDVYAVHRSASLGPLPDATREVLALGRFYGSRATVRIGETASEADLKRDAEHFDVLHLATHGIVDVKAPMYSALLLAGSDSEDGLLEAREIVALPIRADLVVLSACDTARGRIEGGEGAIGLSWAILATGCPRIVATQWSVSSAAAARLMIAFHSRLSKRESVTNVAASLRDAQLEMIRTPQFSHPYYWAGFVMVGRD